MRAISATAPCVKTLLALFANLAFFGILSFPIFAQATKADPAAACADPHGVLKAFYESNDARSFDASMKYLANDLTIDTGATGVNGYIMAKRHAEGTVGIRRFLVEVEV
jgi:hypothetical protein